MKAYLTKTNKIFSSKTRLGTPNQEPSLFHHNNAETTNTHFVISPLHEKIQLHFSTQNMKNQETLRTKKKIVNNQKTKKLTKPHIKKTP